MRTEPFVMTDDADYAWLKDALGGLDSGSSEWMLVDLRQLRAHPPKDMPSTWRQKSLQFDLLVVAPTLTPSTLMGSLVVPKP